MRPFYKIIISLSILLFTAQTIRSQTVAIMQVNGVTRAIGDTLRICVNTSLNFQSISTNVSTTNWIFAGATPATGIGPTVSSVLYATAGVYRADVLVVNGPDRDSTNVFIDVSNVRPTMDFTFTPNNVCGGTPINFTSNVTGGIPPLTYNWNWTDGSNLSNTQNDIHTFVAQGPPYPGTKIFNVWHYATTAYGCKDSISKPVSFRTTPHDSIGRGNNMIQYSLFNGFPTFSTCVNAATYTFQFLNLSLTQAGNSSYTIQWGDGTMDTTFTSWPAGVLINHTFPLGNSVMTVTTFGSDGCNTVKKYNVFLGSNPSVGLNSPGNTSACAPVSFTFGINSVAGNPPGTTYQFIVNDGSAPINFTHPPPATYTHTFNTSSCGNTSNFAGTNFPNSFTATIIARNPCGQTPSGVASIYISQKPNANILASPGLVICPGVPMTLINNTTGGAYINPGNAANCIISSNQVWSISPATGYTVTSGSFGSTNGSSNTVLWTNGTGTIGLNFTTAGTYNVKLYASNDCGIDSTIRTICVRNPPTATFTMSADSSCGPKEVDFFNTSPLTSSCALGNVANWGVTYSDPIGCASGVGPTFAFSGGSTNLSISPKITFTRPGRYIISLTMRANIFANICPSAIFSDTFWVKEKPKVSINPIASICANSTISASAVINNCYANQTPSYNWTFTNGTPMSSTAISPSGILYSQVGSQPVQLAVTNECGTTNANINVNITNPPTANAGPDRDYCSGQNSTVGINPVFGVTYLWAPTTGLSNANIANPTVNLTYNGLNSDTTYTYILTASQGANCFSRDTVLVKIRKGLTITTNPLSASICSGDTVRLTAAGADSYTWTPAASLTINNLDTVFAFPTTTTIYNVVGSLTNGCTGNRNVNVNVTPRPIANTGLDKEYCSGTTVTIGTSSAFGVTYSWLPTTGLNNASTAIPTVNLTYNGINSDTTYTYILTASVGPTCFSKDTVLVKVKKGVQLVLNPTSASLCSGDTAQLIASGAETYLWSPAGSLNVNNKDTVLAFPNTTTTYAVTGSRANGCFANANLVVTVTPRPNANAGIDKEFCSGLNTTIGAASIAGITYNWQPNTGLNSSNVSNPTVTLTYNGPFTDTTYQYILTASANVSCSKSDTVLVKVKKGVDLVMNPTSATICAGDSVLLTVAGASAYTWSPSVGLNATNRDSVWAKPANTVTYTVNASTPNGCQAVGTAVVTVRPLPNTNAGLDTLVCNTATNIQLTGAPIGGTWTGSIHVNSTGLFNAQSSGIGNYQLYYTATLNGCSKRDSMIVNVTTPIIPFAGNDTTVCQNTGSFIVGAQPLGGIWNIAPQITNNGLFNPTMSGTFNVTYNFGSGTCLANDSRQIIVQPILANNIISANQQICTGNLPALLTGTNVTGGSGAFIYQWQESTNGTTFSNIATAVNNTYQPTALTANRFYRRIVNSSTCKADTSQNILITVKQDAIAQFSATKYIDCAPFNINNAIVNTTVLPLQNGTYTWYVNGVSIGSNTTGSFPGYIINTPGDTVTIKLVVQSQFGCKADSTTRGFKTIVQPTPSFTKNSNGGCAPIPITFTNNTPNIAGYNYFWDFGNGQTSNLANPAAVVFNVGPTYNDTTYTIKFGAFASCDTVFQTTTVNIKSKPKAIFFPAQINGCSPFLAKFVNKSLGMRMTFYWDFGDGIRDTTITKDTVFHTYNTGIRDTFNVRLIAVNECGRDTITYNVIVDPRTMNLDFNFNATDLYGCLPHTVRFFNNSNGGNNFIWDFGDGNSLTTFTNIDTVTHTYTTAGNFIIKVRGRNDCTDTTGQRSLTTYAKPNVSFTALPTNVCVGENIQFTNTSEPGISLTWRFGDGTTATNTNPTKSYNTAGNYNVTLIGSKIQPSGLICFDSFSVPIVIFSTRPGKLYTIDTLSTCYPYQIKVKKIIPTGGVTIWNFGNGASATGDSVTYTYDTTGVYNLTMTTLASGGCRFVDSIKIVVNGPVGLYNYNGGTFCSTPAQVNFNVTGNGITQFIWHTGDGTVQTTTSGNFSYSYPNPGFYIPFVIIKNGTCERTLRRSDTIKVDRVLAKFGIITANTCSNTNVILSDSSAAFFGVTNWLWTLPNGQTSTLQNPGFTVNLSGSYNFKLVVRSTLGCTDSISKTIFIQVYQKPSVAITTPAFNSCVNVPYNPIANINSVDPISSVQWIISNGNIATGFNPTFNFSIPGVYQVKLVATTQYGCKDSTIINLTVFPSFSMFRSPDTRICLGQSTNLLAGGALTYAWSPANGLSCVNCATPIATPTTNTLYYVTGTNVNGCQVRDSVLVSVVQPFNVQLTPVLDTICVGASVQLNATGASTYTFTPLAGINNATIPNPIVTPANTTTYMLVAKDLYNCFSDTAFSRIVVGQPANINLGPDRLVATGSTINLNAALANGPYTNLTWSPTFNLSCIACPNPQAIIRNAITYNLRGTTIYGCTAQDSITINVFCEKGQVYLPNGFKPTGSNKYMVRGQGIKNIKLFKIFNRAGQVVFEKNNFQPNDTNFGWDGKLNGQLSAPDVYVYFCVIECDNGTPYEYKGNITVIR